MLDSTNSNANAEIEQKIELPDYFSCRNCNGWGRLQTCERLRMEHNCAKQMLNYAIQSGALQIHLQLANPR